MVILDGAGAIDAAIAVALPATPRVAFYGVLSGAASMGPTRSPPISAKSPS